MPTVQVLLSALPKSVRYWATPPTKRKKKSLARVNFTTEAMILRILFQAVSKRTDLDLRKLHTCCFSESFLHRSSLRISRSSSAKSASCLTVLQETPY